MRRALEYTRMFGKPVMSHCEDPDLSEGGVMHEGEMSTMLGLKGIPGESEDVMVARDVVLAGLTGGRLHICHVSTARSLRFIEDARGSGVPVTCEATPHHLTLTEAAVRDYGTNFKMKPPLRSEADRQALISGLKSGLIDAIASDHAPHSIEEKDQEFEVAPFGVIGLETTLGVACEHLLHAGLLELTDLVRLLSTNPARILGLPLGTLKPGTAADITMFDPGRRWVVDSNSLLSKSSNTPFEGWEVRGRAVNTMVAGRLVLRDCGVQEENA
jgi:dihydroorotase